MGVNACERMKEGGIEAKKTTITLVPIKDIWTPPRGHPLWHPRAEDPLDEELCENIVKERKIKKPLVVRDDGVVKGKRRLVLLDGARRTVNGREAEKRLRKAGVIGKTDSLYVKVEFFTGDDSAFLLERLRLNDDPLKKSDRASVLAITAKQLNDLHTPLEAIVAAMPRIVAGKREVEALLEWDNLVPEAAKRFDEGLSLCFLRNVLDAPREKQVEVADKLATSGVKTAAGATRLLREAAESENGNESEGAETGSSVRLRPRKFIMSLRESLEKREAATGRIPACNPIRLLEFLLGSDKAIENWEDIREAAIDAGWKQP